MLQKWMLAGVAGFALLTPLAAVPAVQAHEPEAHHRRHGFEVMYRSCSKEAWTCYGRFDRREAAEHAEHHLRERGFEAFVR